MAARWPASRSRAASWPRCWSSAPASPPSAGRWS
jgi:hypothetical protein